MPLDPLAVGFTIALGALAVVFVNIAAFLPYDVLAERYRVRGVLRLSPAPQANAPTGFAERIRRRERKAMLGSAIATAGTAVLVLTVLLPSAPLALWFLLWMAAFLGRAVVLAVLGAREAIEPSAGPRVSRGGVLTLGERVALPWWWVLAAVQGVFLVAYLAASRPLTPWVAVVAAVSAAASAAGLVFARWLAAQPQGAGSAAELAWSDVVRQRDLVTILIAGPVLAFGVTVTAFAQSSGGATNDPVFPLALYAWGYLPVAGLLMALLGRSSRLRQAALAAEAADARR